MNRQQRRLAARVCRRDGHLTKTDGDGQLVPWCVRCGDTVGEPADPPATSGELIPQQRDPEPTTKPLVLVWHDE